MLSGMKNLSDITERIVAFRDARDWKQFHTHKDMALSLALEAAEVLEVFQWKSTEQIDRDLPALRDALGKELSDVLYWTLLMAHDAGIDLGAAFTRKMDENESKYPVDLAKGSNKKYSDL
jgi:NTP pyrophosphatase (non-canonical NTP hydrolase)